MNTFAKSQFTPEIAMQPKARKRLSRHDLNAIAALSARLRA
ncbi:hypothetical protein [Bradyrhizobium brasilense]|nr:hypothetical protein [Bradyrhizobium brasilense]